MRSLEAIRISCSWFGLQVRAILMFLIQVIQVSSRGSFWQGKPCSGVLAAVLRSACERAAVLSFGLSSFPNGLMPPREAKSTTWVCEESYRQRLQHICWWRAFFCSVYCIVVLDTRTRFFLQMCFFFFLIHSGFHLSFISTDSDWIEFCSGCV